MPEKLDEKTQAIADRAIELRDTGQDDYSSYIKTEAQNGCEACQLKLAAIRAEVEAAPVPVIDLAKVIAAPYEQLRVDGNIVKVKRGGVWSVGVKK